MAHSHAFAWSSLAGAVLDVPLPLPLALRC